MSWFISNAAVADAKQRQKEWHREAQMQRMVQEARQTKADSIGEDSREARSTRHRIGRLFKKQHPFFTDDSFLTLSPYRIHRKTWSALINMARRIQALAEKGEVS